MKRRELFSNLTFGGNRKDYAVAKRDKILADDGLEEMTTAMNRQQAAHILRRLTFAPSPEQIDQLTSMTPSDALFILLGDGIGILPEPPDKNWVHNPEEDPLESGSPEIRFEIEGRLKKGYNEFNDWWIDLMRNESAPVREKLTLFWSTVWTIEFTYDTLALIPPGLCYRNNQTLRSFRLGNYKEFAEAITLDGAMLLYQSLQYSNRNIANENYMREMMELFTMGTGDIITGERNYTEGDIKEGSKALTGWRTAPYMGGPHPKGFFETYFSPNDHILDSKTFMGTTIQKRDESRNTEDLVREEEVRGIINIMFEQRPMAIARFVCDKIYRYFVYSNPAAIDEEIIDGLAQILIENDFILSPVFSKLLNSKHFFNSANFGIQFKRPPEFIVGLERMLDVKYEKSREAIFDLEQVLYDPPNVGSWRGYRSWLSTKTVPLRYKYAKEILSIATDEKLINLAKKFMGYDNATTATDSLVNYFLPVSLDTSRMQQYLSVMLQGAGTDESGWSALIEAGDKKAADGIRALIDRLLKSPDFQLC
jgi:uncharacterized protein (DUF1800 family)